VANFRKPAFNLRDQFHGMLTPNAGWLNGDWNEFNVRRNTIIIIFSIIIIIIIITIIISRILFSAK